MELMDVGEKQKWLIVLLLKIKKERENMKNIKSTEVEFYITEALKNNLKNILFVSITCNTNGVLKWFDKNKEYKRYGYSPKFLYEEKNGKLVKYENYIMMKEWMDDLNNKNSILFIYPFGDKCIYDFEGFTNILKSRKYINFYPDGLKQEVSCENLGLFIGITTGTGSFGMDEKYFELFDEVYLLDK